MLEVFYITVLGRRVGCQVKKFELVSSDDHQMSVTEGRERGSGVHAHVWCLGEGGGCTLACDLSHDTLDVPTILWTEWCTDTSENITLPELRLRAGNIILSSTLIIFLTV